MSLQFTMTQDGIRVYNKTPCCGYWLTPLTSTAKRIIKSLNIKDDRSWWQLQSLKVHKDYRGMGYGKILLDDAIQRTFSMNCNLILRASPFNTTQQNTIQQLIGFYQAAGFCKVTDDVTSPWSKWLIWPDLLRL